MLENEENTETVRNKPIIIRSTIDLQRLKLEKLMKNPVNITFIIHFIFHLTHEISGKSYDHTRKTKRKRYTNSARFC